VRALRRQTLFLHLTAGAPAGKPAACRRIRLPDGCGAVALSDRRTVLRSKLRIANESAAQCRCGHRTAVRATPHANAGWIGRSKIRLSKEPPARRRFRTPLRRNETGGADGQGNGHRFARLGRRRGTGVRVRKYGAASVGAARGALFPTGTCSRFAPFLCAGGCGVKRKGRFCRARAGRHNNAYGKLWG